MLLAYAGRRRERGFTIITVLVFVLIIATLLSGIGVFAVSHQSRALVDSDYVAALSLAEAGVNWEFRKISLDQYDPDQYPGATVNWGGGTFQVWCANKDGSTPWNTTYPNGGELLVFSRGTVDGVTRTVKAAVKGMYAEGDYAIYGTDSISTFNGQSVIIRGDIGTNDQLQFTGAPTVTGEIYFNGPDAGWVGGEPTGYTVNTGQKAIVWPTVCQVALAMFPQGGLTYLATHNDNLRAVPPIIANTIFDSVTLTAGHYYVTKMSLAGSRQINFDNRAGPIYIWVGPEGGLDVAKFRGGSAAVSIAEDPSKAPRIFVSTRGGIDLGGNQQMDALVYAVEMDHITGEPYGHIENSGNPHIRGQLIASDVDLNGNISVEFIDHLIRPITFGYYGFDTLWDEGGFGSNGTWVSGGR